MNPHRGHEWLVRQAALACERLLVLSYSQAVCHARGSVAQRVASVLAALASLEKV